MVRAAQENRLKKIKAIKLRGIIHQQENKLFIESIPFSRIVTESFQRRTPV